MIYRHCIINFAQAVVVFEIVESQVVWEQHAASTPEKRSICDGLR